MRKSAKLLFGFAFLILTIPSLFLPSINWLTDLTSVGGEYTSTFTSEEYAAASWIRENVPNSVILSDPYTQLVISGLAGVHHIGEEYMSGIARDIVKGILKSPVAKTAHDASLLILSQNITADYSQISDEDIFQRSMIAYMRGNRLDLNLAQKEALIVITSRSVEWSKESELWESTQTKSYLWENMFPSSEPIDQFDPSFVKFYDKAYFELLYHVSDVLYVFKVRTESLSVYYDGELESDSYVVYDDYVEGFWNLLEIGSGTKGFNLSLDEVKPIRGANSIEITCGSGFSDHADIEHRWSLKQDWLKKDLLSMYLYGVNDSRVINIFLLTPDWNNGASFAVIDNWNGWAHFVFSLEGPDGKFGDYNLTSVKSLYIANAAKSSVKFDRIVIDQIPD